MKKLSFLLPLIALWFASIPVFGGAPQPGFKAPVQLSGAGSSVVKVVGGRLAPKIVNGVDSGADVRQTLMLSGYAGAVDFVTADSQLKRLRVWVQQNGAATSTYATVDVTTTGQPTDLAVDNVSNHLSDDLIAAEDGVIRIYANTSDPTTPGLPTFAAPVTLTANGTDGQPLTINKITTADVNQDGKPDLIGVGTTLVGGVTHVQMAVFLSTSTGTPSFAAPAVYTTNSRSSGDYVVAANLTSHAQANGQSALDSYPEIVVGGNGGSAGNSANGSGYGEYVVFFNKGDGTFNTDEAQTEYPYLKTIFHYIHGLEIGDINGDGFRDVVTEESNDNNGQTFLGIYYGEADGYAGLGNSTSNYLGNNTSRTFSGGVVIGDLNNDGTPDIALAFEKKVSIYGLTSGAPQSGGNFPGEDGNIFDFDVTAGARGLDLTDSNHDGHLDLLVAENAPQELALVINGKGGGTSTAGAPSAPVANPTPLRLDQKVTLTTTYVSTVAKPKVVILYKTSAGSDFLVLGTATAQSNSTWTLTTSLPVLGEYTFKAEAIQPKPAAPLLSDESDPLTVTLPKLSVVSVTPGTGKAKGTVVVSGPVAPGVTLTLQSSADGSNFSDVALAGTAVRGGKYNLSVSSLPSDQPYYRVIATLGADSVESDNFSLFGVDATIAVVSNDTTTSDDATSVVKTAPATGAGVVADDAAAIPSRAALVPWGDYRTFAIQAKNTSKFAETLSFNGHAGDNNFGINYLAGAGTAKAPLIGSDITSTVTTSGYPVNLAAGATAVIYVRIHCYPGVPKKTAIFDQIICVVGNDTSHRDSVQAIGSAIPASKVAFVTTGQLAGEGGLDNAVAYANAHPGTTIAFEVPSDDPNWTKQGNFPLLVYNFDHALANITAAGTVIDGTTQRDLGDQSYFPYSPAIQFNGHALPGSGGTQDLNSNGLTVMASDCVVKGFNIYGFNSGVYIGTPATSHTETRGVVVQQCYFQGNTSAGITVNYASNNVLGGDAYVDNNSFRALQLNGIDYGTAGLVLNNSSKNVVQGNTFGLNSAALDTSAPNGFTAAAIILSQGSEGNTIGGLNELSRNVISGCTAPSGGSPRYGIDVKSSYNIIEGNFFGLNRYGEAPVPNDVNIVVEGGTDTNGNFAGTEGTLIGGSSKGAGNQIVNATGPGIILTDGSTRNKVQGNTIRSNGTGIYLFSYETLIGGSAAGQPNLITANTGDGILVDATRDTTLTQQYDTIVGNQIGGSDNGQNGPNSPNGKYGLEVFGSVIEVGGPDKGEGNAFLLNKMGNVVVHGPGSNIVPVRGNRFVGSDSLQDVDLLGTTEQNSVGRTANDANDSDGIQNFPVLSSITKTKTKDTYAVAGTLHSKPNSTFVIDFYAGNSDDPQGVIHTHLLPKHYSGGIRVKTDATGLVKFNAGVLAVADGAETPDTIFATAAPLVTLKGKSIVSTTSEFSDYLRLPK